MLIPAATVLPIRDGADGIEVFMVKRYQEADFASGALVFPGGKLDPADGLDAVPEVSDGLEGLTEEEAAFKVCAIRETFEESGILLARAKGATALLGHERCLDLRARHGADLQGGAITLGEIARREEITLALDALTPSAHWITPAIFAKRFDTWFFLVPAPPGQQASHDEVESVDSLWVSPDKILAEAAAGIWRIVFATRLNLKQLGESETVVAAIEAARTRRIMAIQPTVEKVENGRIFRIPEEAGYGIVEIVETRNLSQKPVD